MVLEKCPNRKQQFFRQTKNRRRRVPKGTLGGDGAYGGKIASSMDNFEVLWL
jgi:hypothetical protein